MTVEDMTDLKGFIEGFLDLPDDELRHHCEQTVRNYDHASPAPHISFGLRSTVVDHGGAAVLFGLGEKVRRALMGDRLFLAVS